MKRILVTGGAGYIGSVLSRRLLDLGYEIVILDSLIYTDVGIRGLSGNPSVVVVKADIRNVPSLKKSLDRVDAVIHLAAIANDPSGELDVDLTRQINLDSYPILLDEVVKAGVRLFINMSSISVYGVNDVINVTEDQPLNPLTSYAVCKAQSEAIVSQYNSSELSAVSLRCGTVCGWSPRMRFDLSTNTLAAYAIFKKKLDVWGGAQNRPQIHVEDVADLFVDLLTMAPERFAGKIFNAAGTNITVSEIAETIKDVMGGKLELTHSPARSDERSYHVSSNKIATELGFTTKRTIRDAVLEIMEKYESGGWSNPDDPIYHNVRRMKSMEKAV